MSKVEPLCQIIGIATKEFSNKEIQFIEAELFLRLCDELKEAYKENNREYCNIINLWMEREDGMLEINFMQQVVNDILLTGEYTLEGIAYYTQTPEEVIYNIIIGSNKTPSLNLARKIIEIHRSIRPDLYLNLMKKILTKHDN